MIFALFGSEELGGYGSRYFLAHAPVPLGHIMANLEFEMIGRRDPALSRDGLWLTGYERSDLGPQLARHGASLVADPHPEQKFFTRSDNYSLAERGLVAQTGFQFWIACRLSHQPGDELGRIDFSSYDASDPIDGRSNRVACPSFMEAKMAAQRKAWQQH